MSCSKPLLPFVCDSLYYLKRNQLERFSIVCRRLKNFIERYLHTKPYRVFDGLWIRGESYALIHNNVQWHPNRDDYSVQQFMATQKCSIERTWNDPVRYSFVEMRPYLGPTVRIKTVIINVAGDSAYNPEHIEQMESISNLWRDGDIFIQHANDFKRRIGVDVLHLVFNSPTILQCQELLLINAQLSFKDYNVLKTVKVIKAWYTSEEEVGLCQQYWQQFLEQPGDKPIVVLREQLNGSIANLLDRLFKAFSSAILPNSFKIVFIRQDEPSIEFRKMNTTSREVFELKKGLPAEWQKDSLKEYDNYTLERSSI